MTLGARVRAARCAAKLSQEALGHAADVHPKHVSEIERGNKDPRFSTVVRLAAAAGTTVGRLAGEA